MYCFNFSSRPYAYYINQELLWVMYSTADHNTKEVCNVYEEKFGTYLNENYSLHI
jgi:hypothetical protein